MSEGCELEFQRWILDGSLFTFACCEIGNFIVV